MKKLLLLLLSTYIFAQSPTCSTIAPMCGGAGLTFENTSNGNNNNLGVGCLDETPNQAWFFMQVGTSGTLDFQISQLSNSGNQIDVDFICWGPFPENSVPNTLCTQLFDFPNGNNINGDNIVACSYSPNAIESFSINNGIQGQIYVLLITNFSNQPGNITLTQTNITQPNAGSTTCDVLCNVDLGGDQTICNGTPLTLTATLTANTNVVGTPSFQWFFNGTLLAGEILPTLNVTQSGQYQVVVTRPGCASSPPPSDTINVSFGGQANINSNPPSLTCNNDETYNLNNNSTIILNGNTGNLVFYNNLADAQSQTNPITNITNFGGTVGQQICAKVNITGDTCTYYACFTLTCTPPPCPVFSNPNGVQSVCLSSDPMPISVNVTNSNSIRFVYFDTPQTGNAMYSGGTVLATVIPSFGTASFNPSILGTTNSLPNVLGTYYVYAIVNPTPQFTTCRPFQEIIINIINPPTAAVISGNPVQCAGVQSLFTSDVSIGTWSSSNNAIITINSNSGIAQGMAQGTAKIIFTIPATPTCNAVTSTFDIVVNPIPPVPTIPTQTDTYCENSIVPELQAIGNQLLWYTTPTGGTGSTTMTPNTSITGITNYYVTQTVLGCESPRVAIPITIYPNPDIIAQNNAPVICSGESTQISLNSGVNNVIYHWNVTSGGQTGAVAGSGTQFLNTILTNTTLNPIIVNYSIIAEANGCSDVNNPEIVTITINPIPNVSLNPAQDFEICCGEKIDIQLSGTVSNTIFNYTVLNFSGVSGFTQGTGTSINDTLVCTGLMGGSVTYLVTPVFGNCVGTAKQITVTIKPTPVAVPLNTNYPAICSGTAPNIIINSIHPNTAFEFTVEQFGVTGAFDGDTYDNVNGNLFLDFQVLINDTDVQGFVEYTIKPVLNGCYGEAIKVRIYVNPLPKPVLQNGIICVDELGVPFQNYIIDAGLDASNHTFVWHFTDNAGVSTTLSNISNPIEVNQIGTYHVVATNTTTGCVSYPSNNAIITSSTAATSMLVLKSDNFADVSFIEINVLNGTGNYLYQLNDSAWQTSNIFENVSFGNHIVRVMDTLGCTYLTENVKIMQHMKFFTPNGDGYHDTWKIFGLEDQPDASITIYNRYGKLLKQLSTLEVSNGWDGTYIGNNLPADDYWFVIKYKEDNIDKNFKSHFSLKR